MMGKVGSMTQVQSVRETVGAQSDVGIQNDERLSTRTGCPPIQLPAYDRSQLWKI